MEAELSGLTKDDPVAWHGYDMNPIVVARSKIVLTMLEMWDYPLHRILQIWFSTCISTEAARTLSSVCQMLSSVEKEKEMRILFDYWSTASIPVEQSIQAWNVGRRESSFTIIPMILSKRDRLDYARYILKGQIFLGGSKDLTGNPTFLPPRYLFVGSFLPPTNESIYCTFSEDPNSASSLLASIEKRFLGNIANLRELIKEKQIKISLSVATISDDNQAVLGEIKGLNPAAIEWSNIPDYLTFEEFFSVARKCSVQGTKHSFHLMNWTYKIFGANLVDYVSIDENYRSKNFKLEGFFKDSSGALPKLLKELTTELLSRARHQNRSATTRDLAAVATLMNPLDLSSAALSFRFYDTYMNFMFENIQPTKKEWKRSELAIFDHLYSTVYASFEF